MGLADAKEPPLSSSSSCPTRRAIGCRVAGVALFIGLMQAAAPWRGFSLWTYEADIVIRNVSSVEYCAEYLPLVRSYLDPYRAPVTDETRQQVHQHYQNKGISRLLIRSGQVGPGQAQFPEGRYCDAARNLLMAQKLFGRIPDVDIYLNLQDQPDVLRTELPEQIPPPPWGYCTTSAHHEISVPLALIDTSVEASFRRKMERLAESHPWPTKINRAVWRGSTTGEPSGINDKNYEGLPRIRLANLSLHHPDVLDAKLTACTQCSGSLDKVLPRLGYGYSKFMRYEDMYRYTMLLDIDGNAWSSRFPQLLSTNAAVVKQESRYREWFRPLLRADEHYVPYSEDLSDLVSQLRNWSARPAELQQMALRATAAYHQLLTPSKQLCYMHLLATEYALVQAANGTSVRLRGSVEQIREGGFESVCGLRAKARSTFSRWIKEIAKQWKETSRALSGGP